VAKGAVAKGVGTNLSIFQQLTVFDTKQVINQRWSLKPFRRANESSHLLVFLEALEEEDVYRLEVVDMRVPLKLLANLGPDSRGGEVDSVQLHTQT
jgi:hypothetical protein